MSEPQITSTKNPIVRRYREAAAGDPPEVMLVEGVKLVWDACEARLPIQEAAVSPRLLGTALGKDVRRRLEREAALLHECADAVLERLSSLESHQGVAVIARRPAYQDRDLLGASGATLLVVAAGIRDPGNLGALLRTAEAAGATGLCALAGGADPFREKAVRGSAGSVFRLPTRGGVPVERCLQFCAEHRLRIVVAEQTGETEHWDADWRPPTALVVGGEGAGVPDELRAAAQLRVRIPMTAGLESLNVAVAAGVLLFEARRQRR
jgi:TrmH family RNA methyltransferase